MKAPRGLPPSLAGGTTLRSTLRLEYQVGSGLLVASRAREPELAGRGEQKGRGQASLSVSGPGLRSEAPGENSTAVFSKSSRGEVGGEEGQGSRCLMWQGRGPGPSPAPSTSRALPEGAVPFLLVTCSLTAWPWPPEPAPGTSSLHTSTAATESLVLQPVWPGLEA